MPKKTFAIKLFLTLVIYGIIFVSIIVVSGALSITDLMIPFTKEEKTLFVIHTFEVLAITCLLSIILGILGRIVIYRIMKQRVYAEIALGIAVVFGVLIPLVGMLLKLPYLLSLLSGQ